MGIKNHTIQIHESNPGTVARQVHVMIDGIEAGWIRAPFFDEENVIKAEDWHRAFDRVGHFVFDDSPDHEIRSICRIIEKYLKEMGE